MFNLARYFRKRLSKKYAKRFIQGTDYKELSKSERSGKKHNKYEMLRNCVVLTEIKGYRISHRYFELYEDGRLVIKTGYRWDGPSGPTVDTPSFMRGSCVHDIFFQCLRENLFILIKLKWESWGEVSNWRRLFNLSNKELRRFCIEDGMMYPRYDWVYYAVKKAGAKHARPKEQEDA